MLITSYHNFFMKIFEVMSLKFCNIFRCNVGDFSKFATLKTSHLENIDLIQTNFN